VAAERHQSLIRANLVPRFGTALATCVAGLVVGLVVAEGNKKIGPVAILAPTLAAAALTLIWYPKAALAILLLGAALIEPVDPGLVPTFNQFYTVVKFSLTPVDILFFLTIAGLLLQKSRAAERVEFPRPLGAALGLLAAATLSGLITAIAANAGVSAGDLYHRVMDDVYLLVIPVLILNLYRGTSALRTFMAVFAAVAAIKGLSGSYAALSGAGTRLIGESAASYLEPTPNLIMVTYLLGVIAAMVRKVKLPVWAYGGAGLAFLALLLSYRRSFWIAAAIAIVLVLIIASRRRGRTVLFIGVVATAMAIFAVNSVGTLETSSAPLLQRAQALTPTGLEENRGDRYRNDERANVIDNLEEVPLTGRGLGVPWRVKQPLAELHDRTYVHFALLWFWLALGPLGVLAYITLLISGIVLSSIVWRRHPDPLIQIGAIAMTGAIVALAIVELTAAFTTIDARFTIVVAAGFGWLVAAWRSIPEPE
jgi:O-Antigen ligase